MGLVVDTGREGLTLEVRRESLYIFDRAPREAETGDLFAYRSPCAGPNHRMTTVEISKSLLRELVPYLVEHPEYLEER